jgi:hypothetical protein
MECAMTQISEPVPGAEVIAEVSREASRLGIPFTPEQIKYVLNSGDKVYH